MIRRWWNSLGFYWQVYLFMVVSFGAIITLVEGLIEPLALKVLGKALHLDEDWAEVTFWIISVFVPTLVLGFALTQLVMRRLNKTVAMAQRLSCGDLGARIDASGDERDIFNRLGRSFNDMADSLERLLSHEKRLLADISHELRSPLTRMGVATALLPLKRDAADFESVVKTLESEIDHMNNLVGTLLEQGRNRLRGDAEYVRVDLTALVNETAGAFDLVANREEKRIVASIDPDVAVWGHGGRIRTILENLLSNALFYAPRGDSIEISVRRMGDFTFLTVRDHGPGVPDEYLKDIFRAFYRVDQSRARKSGGVGLGLTLAHDAAVVMGGDIEARNAGPGLEVTVSLPSHRSE